MLLSDVSILVLVFVVNLKHKMKFTLRADYLKDVVTLAAAATHNRVTAYFATESDARAFAATLPKSVKAEAYGLRTCGKQNNPREYGLIWHEDAKNGSSLAWCVSVRKAKVSLVTGQANETGDKRIGAFVKALSKLEYVENL